MIYTITLNPSLDYIVEVPDFSVGRTNRTSKEQINAGGKGINVSIVLSNLGHKSIALGFLAGFVGREIEQLLPEIDRDFIYTKSGNSRINLKIKNLDGTEINGQGPMVSDDDVKKLFLKLEKIKADDFLVLAGSVPTNMNIDICFDILKKLPKTKVVVDATGDLLLNSLKYKPFLVKPNLHELEDLFQVKIDDNIEYYAKKLKEMGAVNVLVSLGSKGALLVDETGVIHQSRAPKGRLINAVGAGDSMVAGFLSGYIETNDYSFAFKKAVATGSASAFSETFATKEEVNNLIENLNSERIS